MLVAWKSMFIASVAADRSGSAPAYRNNPLRVGSSSCARYASKSLVLTRATFLASADIWRSVMPRRARLVKRRPPTFSRDDPAPYRTGSKIIPIGATLRGAICPTQLASASRSRRWLPWREGHRPAEDAVCSQKAADQQTCAKALWLRPGSDRSMQFL